MKKWILILVSIAIVGAIAVVFYLNKPNRSVTSEKGIEVTAADLVKEYQENETAANTKYLDKAIQVNGTITEVSTNQDGKTTVMLSSNDPMTGVFCTLKENTSGLSAGSTVSIKGFCSGMLSDVRLREAVVVK